MNNFSKENWLLKKRRRDKRAFKVDIELIILGDMDYPRPL